MTLLGLVYRKGPARLMVAYFIHSENKNSMNGKVEIKERKRVLLSKNPLATLAVLCCLSMRPGFSTTATENEKRPNLSTIANIEFCYN